MEQAMADTGLCGFHFVDEAAPPACWPISRVSSSNAGLHVEWWANIRFEKQFTPALAQLMAPLRLSSHERRA